MDTEEIVEVVEEVAEAKSFVVLGGVVGFGLGVAVGVLGGYYIANRRLQVKYDEQLEREIVEAKSFYARLNKYSTPEEAVQALRPEVAEAAEALSRYQGTLPDVEVSEPADGTLIVGENVTVEVNNVFDTKVTDTWDQEAEEEIRSQLAPGTPFIISEAEYQETEGFAQSTLTYYAGDKTLADERDQHIPDVDKTVGLDNLLRFGHGTGDARTVFVRNERLRVDFEVLLSDGKYAHEVLGLQHSDGADRADGRRVVRRMRNE